MINIDSHSFNNHVAEQIDKIKTALKKITPDNIMYFDDALIRKARGVVNAVDEYKWSNNAIVNSLDVKTIKRLVDFLKISKMEYVVLDDAQSFYRVRPLLNTGEKSFANVEYKVPDGFDGRNSFVKHFIQHEDFEYVNDLLWVNSILKANISASKAKNLISVNVAVPYTIRSEKTPFLLRNVVIVWRKK